MAQHKKCPAPVRAGHGASENLSLKYDIARSPRTQRLAAHLHKCGPRPMLECLIAVAEGQPLDAALHDFDRLSPDLYRAIGADVLPVDRLTLIEGGEA